MTSDAPDNPSTPDVDFTRQLPAEVARWEADGIITAEQAEAIRNRYASDSPEAGGSAIGNRVVTVIAIMGAALIGLGIIAFIAANWSEIPKLAKLALMVVGTPAIYVIGWFIGYRFGYVRIGVAVILLGAIAFGASIHLVAQTYHVPVNHPNLVPLWFLGVIPLAYITRSQAVFALSIILFLAAAGFRAQEWVPELNSEDTILLLPGLLPLGAFLFAAGRMQARFPDTRQFARLCDISGLLVAAAGIYFLSFDELWWDIGRSKLSFNALTVEYWVDGRHRRHCHCRAVRRCRVAGCRAAHRSDLVGSRSSGLNGARRRRDVARPGLRRRMALVGVQPGDAGRRPGDDRRGVSLEPSLSDQSRRAHLCDHAVHPLLRVRA